MRFFAEIGEYFEISPRRIGDGFGMARIDSGEIDEVAADSKGTRSCMNEAGGGFKRDAPGGDQLEKREGREYRLEIAGAAHRRAWKDLDVVQLPRAMP